MSTFRTPACLLLFLGLLCASQHARPDEPARARPLDVEVEDMRPGLVASYRSLADADATLTRIDAKPAFTLGRSSPHPRIPPGPFEVTWEGVILLTDPAPLTFHAHVCGEVKVEIDGVTVLDATGKSETAEVGPGTPLKRESGVYRLKVRYRSLPDLSARLQIGWEGPTFGREPLPSWQLRHLAAESPRTLATAQLAEKGRVAVERLGCARCHASAFPAVRALPPAPSLADAGRRLRRGWLLHWLDDPARVRPGAHMPALFAADRSGFVERWLVADHLLSSSVKEKPADRPGDHRLGRRMFVGLGCAACHLLPDAESPGRSDPERTTLTGLRDRLPPAELAAFLADPHTRYPDGRMPRLPIPAGDARNLAAYLLEGAKPIDVPEVEPPTADEIATVVRRLGAKDASEAATALVRAKRCAECHPGLGKSDPADSPLTAKEGGCLSGKMLPRYTLDAPTREAVAAYQTVAAREKHPSPFNDRQRLLTHLGCARCHARDGDRPSPLEAAGSTLGGAMLQNVPFQRTPRLTYPHQRYLRSHLVAAVRDGVSGLRSQRYTYRMPAFGPEAETIVRALAEGDGELPDASDPPARKPADPTLGPLAGPALVGFQGYACVSCHVWNGQKLSEPDPGAVGTDLTRLTGRVRRDWFDRYLEGPARSHPGTPMPAIFGRGKPASLATVLDGDANRQKEALWSYFALGKEAPVPKPAPLMPVPSPSSGESPLVAQIPVRLPGGKTLEGLCLLYATHDLIACDLGSGTLHSAYTGARILRGVQGRLRTFTVDGTPIGIGPPDPPLRLLGPGKPETPETRTFHGYDRLPDGARLRWQVRFASGIMEVAETLRVVADGKRRLLRELRFTGIPPGHSVAVRRDVLKPDAHGSAAATVAYELPEAKQPASYERTLLADPGQFAGSLERPGYRAIAYPRPKTVSGEDRVMAGAVAVDPRSGRVLVASMKTGEILTLHDPTGDGKQARFDNYARGLFEEAFAMLAEPDALYVLHRRNLTRLTDTDGDGTADRFDRVAALDQAVSDAYDYGYGLTRDKSGAFVYTHAPHANQQIAGSGSALRLVPGRKPQEVAFGLRNPLGWCAGPDGEVFFTDNQGEWVATNKLCHLVEGRYYGYPNPGQRQHAKKPAGRTTVWVPYAWAKSINGVAYDSTGGKFGPFAGQLFMAELMFGGAIVRANVEKVNGEYQGACFPFWGPGLLGPVTLAFDPKGPLYVGSITEPGWMAQPDRGALFRIDWTGTVPFEMRSIHARPRGFRIVFTDSVDPKSAANPASYQVEHYRYELTGAYGSPELDRTRVAIERAVVSADGRSVELTTSPLVRERVYFIQVAGVRSARGERPVHPAGAYTLNEIPKD